MPPEPPSLAIPPKSPSPAIPREPSLPAIPPEPPSPPHGPRRHATAPRETNPNRADTVANP